jgi:hypothetical protein
VSPPWFGRHAYADTSAIARKTADRMWADHRCHRVQRYHGGLTPPAPVADTTSVHLKNDVFAMNKHTQSRAAGVSPPWFASRSRLQGAANNVR